MKSTCSFTGVLTPAENLSYLPFPFDVPPGTGGLRLRLQYEPIIVGLYRNLVTLGLFDPAGFRGQAHRGKPDAEVIVSAAQATPGFIPGPILPGRWLAELAVHWVLPSPQPCRYQLQIDLLPANDPAGQNCDRPGLLPGRVIQPRPGWYRGDLHAHTIHSDGKLTVAELLAAARRKGLDFVTLSDHNTVSGLRELADAAVPDLVTIPAQEFTTFYGHALALGVEQWIDWRTGRPGWGINDVAQATQAAGGLFIIAHPMGVGSPACTGCHWEYNELDLTLVDGVEVWNGYWCDAGARNPDNRDWWLGLCDRGYTPVATAGSDLHSPEDWQPGSPSTLVYAEELSASAILNGIRRGRVVVSSGPRLDLHVVDEAGQPLAGIGDGLTTGNETVQLQAEWAGAPAGARLRWWQGRTLLAERKVEGAGQARLSAPVRGRSRFRVELWARDGSLLALTNPITIRPANEPQVRIAVG